MKVIIILFTLMSMAQAMDVDESNAYILPLDINQEVFGYLSPLELRALRLTGNGQILWQLSAFTKKEVAKALYRDSSPELHVTRQGLCEALPFDPDDYQSRYNLITRFDQISSIVQDTVVNSYARQFNNYALILCSSILDFMVSLQNEAAIELKFLGLIRGDYGYEKNHQQAHAFLAEHHHRDSPIASHLLHDGLLNGSYFIRINHQDARKVLTGGIEKGQVWALDRNYNLLKNGWRICDRHNPELAHEFLMSRVDSFNPWAIQKFFSFMSDYQHKDTLEYIDVLKHLMSHLEKKGGAWVKLAKLRAISRGYYPNQRSKKYLKAAVSRNERWAIAPYFEGLKYGRYCVRSDVKKLRIIIDQGCQELDPLMLCEKYYLHHSVDRSFVWDLGSIPHVLLAAIRLGESWAIKEEIISQGNESYRGGSVNTKFLEQVFDLHIVPSA